MNIIIVIIFLIYTFFGAIFEHISYYVGNNFFKTKQKTLSNPIITGFPLYGLGGLLIYYFYDRYFREYNPIVLFLIFGSILSIFEYWIGKFIVNAGKSNSVVDSWDYSNEPFNYEGIISLRHFITWGILSLVVIKIHPLLEDKLKKLDLI